MTKGTRNSSATSPEKGWRLPHAPARGRVWQLLVARVGACDGFWRPNFWVCLVYSSSIQLLSIRDELFDTFRKRHKGVMELEEVQRTTKSLHRMLLAFSEQTQGQKFPENASNQELLEIMMARYEKELMHPIQNLLGGELVRAILIQIQKLKLDIETALLELDQILRANEINFAVLAALPAFLLSLGILALIRAWLKQ